MFTYIIYKYVDPVQISEKLWAARDLEKTPNILKLDEVSDRNVCQALKKVGLLESANMKTLHVTSVDSDIIEVSHKKDRCPICRLERMHI